MSRRELMWSDGEAETGDIYDYLNNMFSMPGVIRKSKHHYRTGRRGEFYSDFDLLLNDPNNCWYVTIAYARKIEMLLDENQVDFLGFIEKSDGGTTGAIRLAAALSIYTGIRNITIRLGRELEFEQIKFPRIEDGIITGKPQKAWLSGATVVIVTDNISSGGEVEKAIKAVEYNGGRVSDIVTYTLREWEPTAVERFEKREPPIKVRTVWYLPEDVPKERLEQIGIKG